MTVEHGAPGTTLSTFRALLFDLDGVLTPTAEVHMRAWSRLFTPVLAAHGVAPYTDDDYFAHIDGRPRYDGVRALLASRGISLPDGTADDAPEQDTVAGLGNRKNAMFAAELAEHGVEPYPGSLLLLDAAIQDGLSVAVVSSSRNADAVLRAAGIRDRFGVVVDGTVAAAEGLPGKPDPATYLDAAAKLGLSAAECVVVEDATSGVASGAAGRFGLVVGVDRGVGVDTLVAAGAQLVVTDLADLVPALHTAL
ncbi:HAD family hydrolase [Mycetocola reblochoni]|uniref:Beta-phosphoglucomutase n=2 Tax=Mycetocola reblochoni TaxID=331618 RepID=A0A1R4IRS2_9MICO|nr:beta-phosphoglucomutase family hydrolase [Mycetocola reblochoni]RLP71142.1 beta-phosphoglucomutase family hydrolase [Mycetocola reblochoni]SJN22582.1 Beta-phosphoglucomutase [Mycetocola reblochoni REB411]